MIFQSCRLEEAELEVIERIEQLKERLRYAVGNYAGRWQGLIRRATFARALQGSNSIEGYNVSVDDAIAAAEGEEPLEATAENWAAITGYRQAMTYVLQLAEDPHFTFSENLIRSLHFMMLQHDLRKNPGRWRPGAIYVRREATGEIVYEGAEAEDIPPLMAELVGQLNSKDTEEASVVRAAMAHLNLTLIHPFSDGNGRMARCLQTLVLARTGTLAPTFSSIEEYLGRNTLEYYDVLAKVGKGKWSPSNDTRPWIRFCLTAHFRQATTLLRRTRELSKLWQLVEAMVTQRDLPDRLTYAVADAGLGYRVRNATYRGFADVADYQASRDLKAAVEAGLLVAHGKKRGRFYVASPTVREVREAIREDDRVPDPFETEGLGTLSFPGLEVSG